MFRPRIRTGKIQIYDVYVQRIVHEGELYWSRYKIFLGFNTGFLAVFSFIFQSDVAKFLNIQSYLSAIIPSIGFSGIIFSSVWLLVNYNGIMWMSLTKNIIMDVEDRIFDDLHYALYHRINEKYESSIKYKLLDVVKISLFVSWLFFFGWIVLFCYALLVNYSYLIPTYPV